MKTCIVTACLLCAALFSQAGNLQKPTNSTSVIEVTCYTYTAQPCGRTTTLCIAHNGPLTAEARKKAEAITNIEVCNMGGGGGSTPEFIV